MNVVNSWKNLESVKNTSLGTQGAPIGPLMMNFPARAVAPCGITRGISLGGDKRLF
jgi:hypothetical protein